MNGLADISDLKATATVSQDRGRQATRDRCLAMVKEFQRQSADEERRSWAVLQQDVSLAPLFCDPSFVTLRAHWEAIRGWARDATAQWANTLMDELTPEERDRHRELARRYSEGEREWENGVAALLKVHGLEGWRAHPTKACKESSPRRVIISAAGWRSCGRVEKPTRPTFKSEVARRIGIDTRTLNASMNAGQTTFEQVSARLFIFDEYEIERRRRDRRDRN